jgi:glyoxylase-like metal-dependent hydrolase (beta-lactamase superfamily II)
MDVCSITVGPFASNCHVILAPGGRALVVDPGGEPAAILDFIRESHIEVAAYLITHGHVDHVHALAAMHARHPAPIGMHPRDAQWAFTSANALPPYYQAPVPPPRIERDWSEDQTWTDAGLTYRVIETPGHSPGSVSFYFSAERVLFPGDVLFQGSVGRTDLPGGNPRELAKSLSRLARLPDETVVYPGHGPQTTIGVEKRTNPFMQKVTGVR